MLCPSCKIHGVNRVNACGTCNRHLVREQIVYRFNTATVRTSRRLAGMQMKASVAPMWIATWIKEHGNTELTVVASPPSDDNMCTICDDDKPRDCLLPCGHSMCKQCTAQVLQRTRLCPFDRKLIDEEPKVTDLA